MITSTWAFGKANAAGALKKSTLAACTRRYASNETTAASVSNGNGRPARAQEDHATQRELFMDVLSANATKRDAKQYLARFKPPKPQPAKSIQVPDAQEERNARHRRDQDRLDRMGVNLGGLYVPSRAIADSPQFTRQEAREKASATARQTLHVALVCLRAPELLDDASMEGLATTLSQLVKLDMRIVLVLDGQSGDLLSMKARRTAFEDQAERLSQAIGRHSSEVPRFITGALGIVEPSPGGKAEKISVTMPELIMEPLKRGIVTVLPSLAYTSEGQLISVEAGDTMAALTRELSGLHRENARDGEPQNTQQASLDRIIVLDEAGGIPSKSRGNNAHVFINLEQEFDDIESELSEYSTACSRSEQTRFYTQHQSNLRMLNRCLALLPSASSALIISPQEAASSSQKGDTHEPTIGAGTRRQKNTLIHNLLTNKPMVSSSLPTARLPSTESSTAGAPPAPATTATLVKRGMPVAIIPPADRHLGWQPPISTSSDHHPPLTLETDPRVDFARLVHLIENSFRRRLDVTHYLTRIHNRTAGLIVAGSYEGAAILTWEQPPHTSDDPSRLVPYLDKFAVLQSSQGSSGVADILFQAMVRTAFPQGVCWRSRQDNPVNKWYFERAEGSWRIPGTQWTMFWTGRGVVEEGMGRWEDYVGVCRGVEPSWAGGGKPD